MGLQLTVVVPLLIRLQVTVTVINSCCAVGLTTRAAAAAAAKRGGFVVTRMAFREEKRANLAVRCDVFPAVSRLAFPQYRNFSIRTVCFWQVGMEMLVPPYY